MNFKFRQTYPILSLSQRAIIAEGKSAGRKAQAEGSDPAAKSAGSSPLLAQLLQPFTSSVTKDKPGNGPTDTSGMTLKITEKMTGTLSITHTSSTETSLERSSINF